MEGALCSPLTCHCWVTVICPIVLGRKHRSVIPQGKAPRREARGCKAAAEKAPILFLALCYSHIYGTSKGGGCLGRRIDTSAQHVSHSKIMPFASHRNTPERIRSFILNIVLPRVSREQPVVPGPFVLALGHLQ